MMSITHSHAYAPRDVKVYRLLLARFSIVQEVNLEYRGIEDTVVQGVERSYGNGLFRLMPARRHRVPQQAGRRL